MKSSFAFGTVYCSFSLPKSSALSLLSTGSFCFSLFCVRNFPVYFFTERPDVLLYYLLHPLPFPNSHYLTFKSQKKIICMGIFFVQLKRFCYDMQRNVQSTSIIIDRAGHSLLFTLFANPYSATSMYHFAIATPLLFWILQYAIRYFFDKSDRLYSSRLLKF
jgi:hypothetical protein